MSGVDEQQPDQAQQKNEAPESFLSVLEALERSLSTYFDDALDESALRALNAKIAGPQGALTLLLKRVATLPQQVRPDFGKRANALKQQVAKSFQQALEKVQQDALTQQLSQKKVDPTLPGRKTLPGNLHPITQTIVELVTILRQLGFEVAEGPDIDWSTYNFDKLGFPPDHPATDMQDSFFIKSMDKNRLQSSEMLLRTHTSTVQIRQMLQRSPPLGIISPGVVYRRDDDATHSPMFFQLEALWVDETVRFSDMKGVLQVVLQRFFGDEIKMRFRPSYFPFVEPGGEVDIERDGHWLEVLGCGMVHPVVFQHVGYDPQRYRGFAFGLGVDRFAMLKYGIKDIRLFYNNDPRFLSQF